MKKRLKIIGGLLVLLAVCLIVTGLFLKGEEAADNNLNLSIEPNSIPSPDGEGSDWITWWKFGVDGESLVEKNLLDPVRGKFDISDVRDEFSRCPSYVDYELTEDDGQVLFKNGFYYGTVTAYQGCADFESFKFKMSADGSTVEIADSEGSFMPTEEWMDAD
jgi:hypothetical protein